MKYLKSSLEIGYYLPKKGTLGRYVLRRDIHFSNDDAILGFSCKHLNK